VLRGRLEASEAAAGRVAKQLRLARQGKHSLAPGEEDGDISEGEERENYHCQLQDPGDRPSDDAPRAAKLEQKLRQARATATRATEQHAQELQWQSQQFRRQIQELKAQLHMAQQMGQLPPQSQLQLHQQSQPSQQQEARAQPPQQYEGAQAAEEGVWLEDAAQGGDWLGDSGSEGNGDGGAGDRTVTFAPDVAGKDGRGMNYSMSSAATSMQTDRDNLTLLGHTHASLLQESELESVSPGQGQCSNDSAYEDSEAMYEDEGSGEQGYFDPGRSV